MTREGSGKTFTAVSWLLNSGIANGYKVLWLVHRQELINQTHNEFVERLGDLKEYGIKAVNIMSVSGSPQHYRMSHLVGQDINICSIYSVASKNGMRFIRRMLGKPGERKLIIVIDEAHHGIMPSYKKVLERIEEINPNRILLGLTATPVRMSEAETRSLNKLFETKVVQDKVTNENKYKYIYQVNLAHLIKTGFLSKPHYKNIETEILGDVEFDLTQEDKAFFERFGDLTEELKSKLANSHIRNELIVNEYMKNRDYYGKTLIFAINQDHAEILNKLFKRADVNSDYAISRRKDSQEVIQGFKNNKCDVLINVQMLTEGTDVPDIQTIFLTRETNSDSLLMQMVGRGLRGEAANGTENAYIVSFHDTWEKISFWMTPEFIMEGIDFPPPPITPPRKPSGKIIFSSGITVQELLLKLYDKMRVNLFSEVATDIIPDGWYMVTDEANERDVNIPVYMDQIIGYQLLEDNLDAIIGNDITALDIHNKMFQEAQLKPSIKELQLILEHVKAEGEMPEYYTFEERNQFDPRKIAKRMIEEAETTKEQEYWLLAVYEQNPILENLYKTFYAFKKTVLDTLVKPQKAEVVYIDERDPNYEIIPNYYDIDELYQEVIEQYPRLAEAKLNSIGWSKVVYKNWFGMCYRFPAENPEEFTYSIYINCLISSPQVSREAVKYLIYHELLHANGFWLHDDDFREGEWAYPNSAELDGELDTLGLRFDLNFQELKKLRFENMGIDLPLWEKPGTSSEQDDEKGVSLESTAGTDKEDVGETEQNSKAVDPEKKECKFCRNCGNRLPFTARFCDVCGENVEYQ